MEIAWDLEKVFKVVTHLLICSVTLANQFITSLVTVFIHKIILMFLNMWGKEVQSREVLLLKAQSF